MKKSSPDSIVAAQHVADVPPSVSGPHALDGRTRHEVARLLLEQGPLTAVAIADLLSISPTAIRRHLDGLMAEGIVVFRDPSRGIRRGRGRPAKVFLLTEAGRTRFGHTYDQLAISALRFVEEHGGAGAVRDFARQRALKLIGQRYKTGSPKVADNLGRAAIASAKTEAVAEALAETLTDEGYAASTRKVGSGVQLCQHHCPVAMVAAEFPQLCEAETEVFADVLGIHVQRLATIARGDAACTTHIPAVPTNGGQPA